jgi:hypothetical protein
LSVQWVTNWIYSYTTDAHRSLYIILLLPVLCCVVVVECYLKFEFEGNKWLSSVVEWVLLKYIEGKCIMVLLKITLYFFSRKTNV